MSIEIVFETHSISTDNERGIATGWLEGSLSATGRRLAAELGIRRRDDRLDAVFTSDLGRAVETAAIAFDSAAVPIFADSRLRECNYGECNGMPVAELELVRAENVDRPFPGGESYREVARRVAEFLTDLKTGHEGERVIVIGHSATKWSLDHLVLGRALEELVVAPFDWRPGWDYALDVPPSPSSR